MCRLSFSIALTALACAVPAAAQPTEAEIQAQVDRLKVCDVDALPDRAPVVASIERSSPAKQQTMRWLTGVPVRCAIAVSRTFESRAERDDYIAKLPRYVTELNKAVFGLAPGRYSRKPDTELTNAVPIENWWQGDRLAGRIALQKLDDRDPFDPEEAVVCMLLTDSRLAPDPNASAKLRSWQSAADKLLTACIKGIALTAEARRLRDAYDASDGITDIQREMASKAAVIKEMAATLPLEPRPASWPPIDPVKVLEVPPPAAPR